MGCLLGARLVNVVRDIFKSKDLKQFLWTDSMVALGWIKSNSKTLKPFVQNRTEEIQTRTNPQEWQHCPGIDNPADIPTRGVKAEELVKSKHWWDGPPWLRGEKLSWPSDTEKMTEEQVELLENENKHIVLAVQCKQDDFDKGISNLMDLNRYHSINKAFRITAIVHRFINKLKRTKTESGPITAEEMGLAEIEWIKSVQRRDFEREILALKNGAKLKNSEIAKLKPTLNQDGLLCVGGRLDQSRMTEEEKHPIILNKGQRLASLIINRSHWQVYHSGVQSTLTQTRGRFWIITGRQMTQNVIRSCMVCRRFQAKQGEAPMAPLPKERIDEAPPFEVTGIDFAGPLYVKVGETVEKAYVCLFTCAVTRAIHLELVSYLTTYEFLLAMRRMIARRGIPHIIHSDNAKTFIRANQDLKEMWSKINNDEARTFYGEKGISWRFIADRAAWWGGYWERLVRSVKTSLRKTLGQAALTYQEMETVLLETEAIINSRPMTYVFSEAQEPTPLTPAHFLTGKRITCLPPQKLREADVPNSQREMTKRLRYRVTLLERLWKRWKQEYLMELRNAHQVLLKKNENEIKVGDVVIIHEDKMPKNMWRLGVITEAMKGRDGLVRSCMVRTPNGNIIRRPISLLYAMEISSINGY